MHFNVLVAAAFLAPAVRAIPYYDEHRQDACAKAVSSGPVKPPAHVHRTVAAGNDCASFLSKTVSPCPMYGTVRVLKAPTNSISTSTRTQTSTKTAKATTKTSTKTVTSASTTISTSLKTIDQTFFSTKEQTQLTTLAIPETTTKSLTETTTTTSTLFVTASITSTFSTDFATSTVVVTSTLPAAVKRDATETLIYRPKTTAGALSAGALDRRHNQCRPSTWGAHNIPGYASPCHGSWAYSSACQGLGVGEKTTTLRPSTAYTPQTRTVLVTPTVSTTTTKTIQQKTTKIVTVPTTQLKTSINTVTKTQTVTTTATAIVTSTITPVVSEVATSTSTAIESVVATSTEVVTSTVLVSPTPSACNSFKLRVSGSNTGMYAISSPESGSIDFSNDLNAATTFGLDGQNRLYQLGTNIYANINAAAQLFVVYLDNQSTIMSAGYVYLTCNMATGTLTCTASSGPDTFYRCPVSATLESLVLGTVAAGSARSDCKVLTLTLICG